MSVYLEGANWQDRILNHYPPASDGERYYKIVKPDGTVVAEAAKLELLNTVLPGNEGTPVNAGNMNSILAAMGRCKQNYSQEALKAPYPDAISAFIDFSSLTEATYGGFTLTNSACSQIEGYMGRKAAAGSGASSGITANTKLIQSGAFTLRFWLFISSNTAQVLLDETGSSSANYGLTVDIDNGGRIAARMFAGKILFAISSSSTIPLNTWTHVILVWDNTTMADRVRMYFNGVLVAKGTAADAYSGGMTTYDCAILNKAPVATSSSGGTACISDIEVYTAPIYADALYLEQKGLSLFDGAKIRINTAFLPAAAADCFFTSNAIGTVPLQPAPREKYAWYEYIYSSNKQCFVALQSTAQTMEVEVHDAAVHAGDLVSCSDGFCRPSIPDETNKVNQQTLILSTSISELAYLQTEEATHFIVATSGNNELKIALVNADNARSITSSPASKVSFNNVSQLCIIQINSIGGLPTFALCIFNGNNRYFMRFTANFTDMSIGLIDDSPQLSASGDRCQYVIRLSESFDYAFVDGTNASYQVFHYDGNLQRREVIEVNGKLANENAGMPTFSEYAKGGGIFRRLVEADGDICINQVGASSIHMHKIQSDSPYSINYAQGRPATICAADGSSSIVPSGESILPARNDADQCILYTALTSQRTYKNSATSYASYNTSTRLTGTPVKLESVDRTTTSTVAGLVRSAPNILGVATLVMGYKALGVSTYYSCLQQLFFSGTFGGYAANDPYNFAAALSSDLTSGVSRTSSLFIACGYIYAFFSKGSNIYILRTPSGLGNAVALSDAAIGGRVTVATSGAIAVAPKLDAAGLLGATDLGNGQYSLQLNSL